MQLDELADDWSLVTDLGYDWTELAESGYGEKQLERLTQDYIANMMNVDDQDIMELWQSQGTVYDGIKEHEQAEVAAHLLDGYSEQEILDGTAKQENHDRAHEAALVSEHLFYQQQGKKEIGRDVPLKALMLLRPLKITGEVLRDGNCLDDLKETKEEIERQEVEDVDLIYAMRVFENPEEGLTYYDRDQTLALAKGYLQGETEDEFGEFEERPLMDIELPWGV